MRSTTAILAAAAVLTLTVPGTAQADETSAPPEHGHMLVLGLEFGEDGVRYRKCVDIAAGRALPRTSTTADCTPGRLGTRCAAPATSRCRSLRSLRGRTARTWPRPSPSSVRTAREGNRRRGPGGSG